MEIEEGNKLIAIYDGWQEDMILDQAEYDSNWNWLIPVVKKILAEIELYLREGGHDAIWDKQYEKQSGYICEALLDLEIEPLWETVVEAIQVLNTINSK